MLFPFVAIGDYIDLFLWLWVLFSITFESPCIFVEHLNIFQFSIWNGKNASNVDLPVRWTFEFFSSFHTLFIFSSFNTRNTFICCLYCMCSVISSLCEKFRLIFFFIDKMEHTSKNWFDNTQIWCDNKSIMEFGRLLPKWFSIRARGIWKMVKINCIKIFRQIRIFRRNFQFIWLDPSMMTGDLWTTSWEKSICEELLEKNRYVKNFLRSFFYLKKEFMTGNLEILFTKFIMRSIFRLKTERESYFV